MTRSAAIAPVLVMLACNDPDDTRVPAPPAAAPVVVPSAPAQTPMPVPGARYFDPESVRAGDTLAGLRVEHANLQRTPYNEFAGSVTFSGTIELAGEYRPHFDFPEVNVACFWADSVSSQKLPRMRGDRRTQVWFCFRNQDEAVRRLGTLTRDLRRPMTIAIDTFTAHISQSDAWDEAVLR